MLKTHIENIKNIDKQVYRAFVITLVCFGILFIVPVALFIKAITLQHSARSLIDNVRLYEDKNKKLNPPSEERLSYLSKQLNDIQEYFNSLEDALHTRMHIPQTPPSPLEFKEELFRVKQSLQDIAKTHGIGFPEEYGLQEYEITLPKDEELPSLMIALRIIEELFTTLLSADVHAFDSLMLTDIIDRTYSETDPATYTEYTFSLQVHGSYETLIALTNLFKSSRFFYTIHSLSVSPSERKKALENELSIQLSFEVFFPQTGGVHE